jgi:hypothetical protein
MQLRRYEPIVLVYHRAQALNSEGWGVFKIIRKINIYGDVMSIERRCVAQFKDYQSANYEALDRDSSRAARGLDL